MILTRIRKPLDATLGAIEELLALLPSASSCISWKPLISCRYFLFFFTAAEYFHHSLIFSHLSCFQYFIIANNAAVNELLHGHFCVVGGIISVQILRGRTRSPWGNVCLWAGSRGGLKSFDCLGTENERERGMTHSSWCVCLCSSLCPSKGPENQEHTQGPEIGF